jgi:hypothetical protein
MYGSILAWHAGMPTADPAMSQQMVDAYAAQHATNTDRRNCQSVAVHLMSLCAAQEHRVGGTRLRQMIGSWAHRDYPQLVPRPSAYPITSREVADVSGNSRPALVGDWAISTWAAWSAHHDTIRTWLTAELGLRRQHCRQ